MKNRMALLLLALLLGLADQVPGQDSQVYLQQIKPLLRARCYACHGVLKQESDMRLDTAESIRKAGVIDNGELLARISSDDPDVRMPPEGEPLEPSQVLAIRRWIDGGAASPAAEVAEQDPRQHWSFQQVRRPNVPSSTFNNPIDALLEARRERHAVAPQPAASKLIQLRRLYLDLLGVPPSLGEIAAFRQDDSPDAYEQVVERLLKDARHGERWGRHWMDVWRYSEWWGLGQQLRNSQKHIWHWRDWIVESINDDLPYDEMVRQMLAADELYPNDLDKLRGSGYLARNWFLFNRNQWMNETVEHVGKGFLGLTFNCCKCHDHKFDPIPQADFYRFRAFFEPYHVRTDVLPGVTDVANDGIPRAFDGVLDARTQLFIRGNEKHPDESTVITPGVPDLLAFGELEITAVDLPAAAWQPERRSWVVENQLASSQKNLAKVERALESVKKSLAAAQQVAGKMAAGAKKTEPQPDGKPGVFLVHDKFETLDKQRWQLFGGKWVHEPGQLQQQMDGAKRAALRLRATPPGDFEASLRFTIRGGSMWRSVGLGFDSTQMDPSLDFKASEQEQQVYVSAYAGGSKVHASYRANGKWNYPEAGRRLLPIELNREYTLRVQVRGSLINAYLNDQLVVAWKTPIKRTEGAIQLTTFDVLPTFHEFTLKALDPQVALVQPSGKPPGGPATLDAARAAVVKAEGMLGLAELDLAIAVSQHESLIKRAAAWRDNWSDAAAEEQAASREAAIRSQHKLALLQAERGLAAAEMNLAEALADKKPAVQKQVDAARANVTKAEEQLKQPIGEQATITAFVGAEWSATRFTESRADDPEVDFPATSSGRRTALARWITDHRNPLTARVAANHIWLRHMGQPLVGTMFDFGRHGDRPTHPDVLDWLAAELMENGWSMKHLHRVIVTSAAYRMSSSKLGAEESLAKDPENKYYWRRVSIALESQAVRDSLLSLAGTLDLQMGGPPILPPQQEASKRRSLYFFHSNNSRNLFLTMFDEAVVTDCYRRERSIVPQQALALTNSRLVLEASAQIAQRLSRGAGADDEFISRAFIVLLGMEPNADERAACAEALSAWRALPEATEQTARSNLAWTLLNHNDFVTIR